MHMGDSGTDKSTEITRGIVTPQSTLPKYIKETSAKDTHLDHSRSSDVYQRLFYAGNTEQPGGAGATRGMPLDSSKYSAEGRLEGRHRECEG